MTEPTQETVQDGSEDDGSLFPPDSADTTTADDVDDPHAVDEDPELHIGAELLDPWEDATALDWPNDDDEDEDA